MAASRSEPAARLRRSTLVTPCDLEVMRKAARTAADVIRLELQRAALAARREEQAA